MLTQIKYLDKKTKNFTTTLSHSAINWLDIVSKEIKQQKNEIIEDALRLWRREYIQKKISESYKNAKNDSEWLKISNEDLGYWGEVK